MDTEELEILGHKMKFAKSRGHIFGSDQLIMERHWRPGPGDLVADIGCGPGTWSFVALARGARVIAYDAKRDAIDIVNEQAALNGWTDRFQAVWKGVLDKVGHAKFGVNSFKDGQETCIVETTTIDHEFEKLGPLKLVNIDAEWSDVEVMEGARRTLRRDSPKIIIEVHDRKFIPTIECIIRDADTRYRIHEEGAFLVAEVLRG